MNYKIMHEYFDEFFHHEYRNESKGRGKRRIVERVVENYPQARGDYFRKLKAESPVNYDFSQLYSNYECLVDCSDESEGTLAWLNDFKREVTEFRAKHRVPRRMLEPFMRLRVGTLRSDIVPYMIIRNSTERV